MQRLITSRSSTRAFMSVSSMISKTNHIFFVVFCLSFQLHLSKENRIFLQQNDNLTSTKYQLKVDFCFVLIVNVFTEKFYSQFIAQHSVLIKMKIENLENFSSVS